MIIKKDIHHEETMEAGSSIKEFIKRLSFGEYVRALREEDETTQEEIAEKMGCSKQYISNIENGRASITPATAAKLAEAMGYFPAPFLQILLNEEVKKIDSTMELTIIRKTA